MKHLDIKIYGRVQNVSFRYYARDKARELGIKGFVRNELDNSVYIEAEADRNFLNKFLIWCRKGPRWAKVKDVEIQESEEIKGYEDFTIEY